MGEDFSNFVGPEDDGTTEIVMPDPWKDGVSEVDNPRVDDDALVFEYRDATVRIVNQGFGEWESSIRHPDVMNLGGPGGPEHHIRASIPQGAGWYIGAIERVGDGSGYITMRSNTNFQPVPEAMRLVERINERLEKAREEAAQREEYVRSEDG